MELDEMRQMGADDLRVKERETREEIFRLRLKLRTNQLDKSAALSGARRNLARIMTVIKQKSADAGGAAKAK
ncbi:MAG: 50S ribosomal protein L29 [Candidatus Binataceae bacterium]